ncbi:hypothetical protein HDU87_007196 [Geranomyces variabilis]|uniref:2-dehydropantoate 2-reductase n=1 Tax=Geranomyces variabilis TaxID=109894 RepID=A0AAD5TGV9_9FUNG|nr:hypothetical protein HDU87_007196 [Geranomyces variabilis]
MANSTNILIVGAGAVGAFYGSRLHQPEAGAHVSVVCRSNHAAVAANGFRMQTRAFGEYDFRPAGVFKSCEEAATAAGHFDYVIVATKALPDIDDEPATIAPVVRQATAVVLIQNGWGIEEPFQKRFPHHPVLSAVTVISAAQTQPGVIVQHRWTRISIGSYRSGGGGGGGAAGAESAAADGALDRLIALFHAGGIADAEQWAPAELQRVRWHKLAINAAFNPSAVLSGGRANAEMLNDPTLREHCVGCIEEVFAAGARLFSDEPFPPPHLATADKLVASSLRNAGSKPSMLLDWEAGRAMELEVILGNPIRTAKAQGIDMPRLSTMYAMLKSMAEKRGIQRPRGAPAVAAPSADSNL